MPARYEDNLEFYDDFVETFGTHYIESGGFGGVYTLRTIIDENLFKENSKLEIEKMTKAKLLTALDAEAEAKFNSNKKYKSFQKYSSSTLQYYGGLANLKGPEDKGQFLEWQKSVAADPWLYSVRLVTISQMVTNLTLRHEIMRAVDAKLNRAMCTRAKKNLESLQVAHPEMRQIKAFIEDANTCIQMKIPNNIQAQDLFQATKNLIKKVETQHSKS